MKNNVLLLMLLTFFTYLTGCLSGPQQSQPQEEKVRVKSSRVGTGMSDDLCDFTGSPDCAVVLSNDSASYSICFEVYNGESRSIRVDSARLSIYTTTGTLVTDTCPSNIVPRVIKSLTSAGITTNYCMANNFMFQCNDTLQFQVSYSLVDSAVVHQFTTRLAVCAVPGTICRE